MKKIVYSVIIFICIILIIFFVKNNYKNNNIGNNNISKSSESIVNNILNINSFKAKISVEITTNKNNTKYILNQKFAQPNITKQIVDEPKNIEGLTTIYDGNNLKINNTKLNLNIIYENYQYICENDLFLNSFIEDYKKSSESNYKEENDNIIMYTKTDNNKMMYKILTIDKKTGNPIKLEIQDMNKNTNIYIIYNEIKLNSTNKDEILK